jgi:hypothetical protein
MSCGLDSSHVAKKLMIYAALAFANLRRAFSPRVTTMFTIQRDKYLRQYRRSNMTKFSPIGKVWRKFNPGE